MAGVPENAQTFWERGRAAFPTLALELSAFTALAERHLPKPGRADEAQKIHATDLFLVCACLARIAGALEKFEELYGDSLVKKGAVPREVHEEMKQAMLVKLLVPERPGVQPKLADYSGRGPLGAFIRIAAARAAVDQHRLELRTQPLLGSFADEALASSRDTETSFLSGRHEEDFRTALQQALISLGSEDRMILRLHHREGLTASELAPLIKSSRSTAHRRLQRARESLTEAMRMNLKQRLKLSTSALDSLMQLYNSHIVPALTAVIRQGLAD